MDCSDRVPGGSAVSHGQNFQASKCKQHSIIYEPEGQ